MYNVCICVFKIPVIVLKSKNKRLTCYIVSAIGSLGYNPTAAAVPFSVPLFLQTEHYAATAEETALSVKDLCPLTCLEKGSVNKENGRLDSSPSVICSLQRGRFTLGERGPEVASGARRKTAGFQRRCSLMRVTLMWWHRWPVSTATACWQWNVIFSLLPFYYLSNKHSGEMELNEH